MPSDSPCRPQGPRAHQCDTSGVGVGEQADVIVVGAGPGGSAAATFLARRGLQVVLLEKSQFPREKVCGDGLTPRAVRMLTRLGIDTSMEAGWWRTQGLRIHGGDVAPFEMAWPELADFPNYGLVCRRAELDDLLAGHAVVSGASLITDARVTEPLVDGAGRIVGVQLADGRRFRAPIVVAADGNAGRLGLAMGVERLPNRPMGVAARTYYSSPLGESDFLESWLELRDRDGNLQGGYGWLFPMGDGIVNVGLGMLNSSAGFKSFDHRDALQSWIAGTPEEWGLREANQLQPIGGAALPMAFSRKPAYLNGLLLVGDAGGMVSPFNGEGISYALEAAELAADATAEAHSRGVGTSAAEKALRGYPANLQDRFGGYYRLGTVFSRLISDPRVMHLCITYGLPRKRLMRLVHKLLANLTDAHHADVSDRLINALSRVAPKA